MARSAGWGEAKSLLRIFSAGALLAAATVLTVIGAELEWDCVDGGPHSWLAAGAGVSSGSAVLVLFWSRRGRRKYAAIGGAVLGGVIVYLAVLGVYIVQALATCLS